MNRQLANTTEREVRIPIEHGGLAGDLVVPANAQGLVLFAHGSGSSRRSPRNAWVAAQLRREGIATLLFDLLTSAEEERDLRTREHRFDIPLLAMRLVDAGRWVDTQPDLEPLALGFFGASTGSGAALVAAATLGTRVSAIVSRGGRPDLAGAATLGRVTAATLLIVGGNDDVVLDLNRRAYEQMHCEKRIAVVPGATHLFEEPGTLEQVAALAAQWFARHLRGPTAR